MNKRKLLLAIVAGALLISCSKDKEVSNDERYVKIFTIGNANNQTMTTFHGVVHAKFEPNLSFRVNGKIISRAVDIGQSVKSGQVLGTLDNTDYKLSADSANSQVAASKSNYVTQQANLGRYKQLLEQNFVSQAQYDTQKAQYDSAKAQYEEAKNQLSNSKNQVKYTTLVAPSDGIITSTNMEAGQVVTSGQVVATMAVSGDKEVIIELPEAQVNNYKAGMPATIKLWATDKVYNGSVRVINQASDQQTRTFTARVIINSPESEIKYGMAADVTIAPLNSQDGMDLPLDSIYAINGISYIWLINAKSQVEQVEVKILSTDGSSVRVAAPSLKNGDKIVKAGANFIHAGQTVKEY